MSPSPYRRARRFRGAAAAATVILAVQGIAASGASAAESPAVAKAKALQLPNVTSDINDWSCRATAGGEPVVLVHGTFGLTGHADQNAVDRWGRMAAPLKKDGHCVYALQYGVGFQDTPGVDDITKSAAQLKTFVDGVKAASGASKVKLVSHSQGGLVSRYYLKDLGGSASTGALVGLGTPNRGTETFAAQVGALVYPAVRQMLPDSDFLKKLNSGSDVQSGVSYTMIATPADDTVIPYTSAHLQGPASQLTNVTLSGATPATHDNLLNDADTIAYVREAVRSAGPLSPDFRPGGAPAPGPTGTSSPAPPASPSPSPSVPVSPSASASPSEGAGGGPVEQPGESIDAPLGGPLMITGVASALLFAGALVFLGIRRRRAD
ncbi:esterase/lipase family protein [Streptomyces sp. IBSNAI002]|uniref:esterase/lipase family protein n=1 Tax=Streptomyces sp. IBSNAI002 TaxID=3457500 RepID=UPI003FD33E8B